METHTREEITSLKEYIRKQDRRGNLFTQGTKMVLSNRKINVIFNVILHIACRYPHLYEQLQDKQGEKAFLKLLFFCLQSQCNS